MCSCRRWDRRDAIVYIPELKNEACAQVIRKALVKLSNQPNMGGPDCLDPESMEFDFEDRVLKLEYNSMKLAVKNIEHAIAKAGFAANDIPADPGAANSLPPECKQ